MSAKLQVQKLVEGENFHVKNFDYLSLLLRSNFAWITLAFHHLCQVSQFEMGLERLLEEAGRVSSLLEWRISIPLLAESFTYSETNDNSAQPHSTWCWGCHTN